MEELQIVIDEAEATIDHVMQNIFSSCDTENTGFVSVSKLIAYITPFMQENLGDLMQLKTSLEDVDPMVDSKTFYSKMSEWTNKFNEDNCDTLEDNSFHNISPRDLTTMDANCLPFVQSTPRSSFGHRLLKGYVEAGILNLSSNSTSFIDNANTTANLDKTYFEDQINELLHKNKNCNDELMHVRLQLASTEEQLEQLQIEMRTIQHNLIQEQQINEQLQKDQIELDDLREISLATTNNVRGLERQVSTMDKQNGQLLNNIAILEKAKLSLEQKIVKVREDDTKNLEIRLKMQEEISVKETLLAKMEDHSSQLAAKLWEAEAIAAEYARNNKHLLMEKDALQKQLTHRKKNAFQLKSTDNFNSKSFSEYSTLQQPQQEHKSPTQCNTQQEHTSPTHSKTQQFTSPIKTHNFAFYNKDAPIARTVRNIDANSSYTTCTPNKFGDYSIMDVTPPLAVRDLEHLKPIIEYEQDSESSTQITNNRIDSSLISKNPRETSETDLNINTHESEKAIILNDANVLQNDSQVFTDYKTPINTGRELLHTQICKHNVRQSLSQKVLTKALSDSPLIPNHYVICHSDPKTWHLSTSCCIPHPVFGTPTGEDGSPAESPRVRTDRLLDISTNVVNNSFNASSSDDDLFCKMNTTCGSPQQSLEAEISQAIIQNKLQPCNHQEQFEYYEREIERIQTEHNQSEKKCVEAEKLVADYEKQLEKMNEATNLQNIGGGDELKSTLDQQIYILELEKTKLHEDNLQLNKEIKALMEQLQQLKLDMDYQLTNVAIEKDALEMKLLKLQGNKKIIKKQNETQTINEIKSQSVQTSICQESTTTQTDLIDDLNHEEIKQENIRLTSEIIVINLQLDYLNNCNKDLIDKNDALDKRTNNLLISLNEKSKEVVEISKKLSTINVEIEVIKAEKQPLLTELKRLQEWNKQLQCDKNDALCTIDALEKSIIEDNKMIEVFKIQVADLEKENVQFVNDNEKLRDKIEELALIDAQFRQISVENCLFREELEAYVNKLGQIDGLEKRLAELNKEHERCIQEICANNQELLLLNNKNSQLQEENDSLKNNLKQIQLEDSSRSNLNVDPSTISECSSCNSLKLQLVEMVKNSEVTQSKESIISECECCVENINDCVSMANENKALKDELDKAHLENGENMSKIKTILNDKLLRIEEENKKLKNELVTAETETSERVKLLSNENLEFSEQISCLKMSVIDGEDREASLMKDNLELLKKLEIFEQTKPNLKGGNYDRWKITQKKLETKIDNLEDQIENSNEIIKKLQNCEDNTNDELIKRYSTQINVANKSIRENASRLRISTFNIITKWRPHLEKFAKSDDFLESFDNQDFSNVREFSEPFDANLFSLMNEITLTSNFLDIIGDVVKPELRSIFDLTLQVPSQSSTINTGRKLTLKPPTIHVRPISPDSPNLEIDFTVSQSTTPIVQNLEEIFTMRSSPDSAGHNQNTFEDNEQVKVNNNHSNTTACDPEYLQSLGSPDKEANAQTENSDDSSINLQLLEHLESTFEDIGNENVSEAELDEKLTSLVLEFMIDNATLKKRYKKTYTEMNTAEVKQKLDLDHMTSIAKTNLSGQILINAETQMEIISKSCCHATKLAGQFGALKQEQSLRKSISFMINYVKSLKEKLELTRKKLCKCTNLTSETVLLDSIQSHENTQINTNIGRIHRFRNNLFSGDLICLKVMMALMFACFFIAALFLGYIYLSLGNQNFKRFNGRIYTFRWAYWDEIFAGFIHRDYSNGPPPV